ncbi:MAG: tetratricopeptide repeat protein [Pyrinomonadaceae bacterium]
MNVKRFLLLSLYILLFGISVQAFQVTDSIFSSKTAPQNNSNEDNLNRHLSAAETFQLSGDLQNAAIENQAIVAISLQRLGNLSLNEGNVKRAVRLLGESVTANDDSQTRTDLAIAQMRLSDVDAAISQAQAAINLDPKNARAHHILGRLFYMKGEYAAALPELERSMILEPDFDTAYTLGMTYLQIKQVDRAKLLFEELQTALKKNARLNILLAHAFEDTGYYPEAEDEVKKALAIDPNIPRAHFYIGFLILQYGGTSRLAEAGKEFDAELKINPQDFYSNFFRGVVYNVSVEHAKAIPFLEKAIQINPNIAEPYLFLGQSYGELGNTDLAEKNLRRAIELTKDAAANNYQIRRAHFLLGRVLLKTNRKAEAEKELALARQLQGQLITSTRDELSQILGQVVGYNKNADASRQITNDRTKAGNQSVQAQIEESSLSKQEILEAEKIKAQLSEILAQAYHNLGVIAAQQGNLDESLAKFAAAAEWKPDFPGLDRNWGITSFRANQFDKAIAPLSRWVKSHPEDALSRRMLAVSYYFNKNYKSAVETLKPIEATLPKDSELAYFYGISLVQLERQPEAAVVFANLAAQNSKDAQVRFYAAQGFVLVGDYERAVKEFRAAATLDPNLAQAHYNAGQSLIRLNRLDEAEKEFRQELKLNPADEQSKYSIAYTLLERKINTDEALSLLREAILTRPDYADARYQLGKALIEKGEITEAVEQLENAANAAPDKDYIHYQLSIAYRRAARPADAEKELKIYRDLKDAAKGRKTASGMGTK